MQHAIHIDGKHPLTKQIAKALHYKGRKFQVQARESVEVHSSSCMWAGGSRSQYFGVSFPAMQVTPINVNTSPFKQAEVKVVSLEPGAGCVVEHCLFCGKDMGLTIYVHPNSMAGLVPEQPHLNNAEQIVLHYTKTLKNSYGGRSNIRFSEARYETHILPQEWRAATESLQAKRLLGKTGALTPAGRNAVPSVCPKSV